MNSCRFNLNRLPRTRRRRTALYGFCPDLLCGICRSKSSSNSKSVHSKTLPTENFRFWRADTVQLTRTESGQRCPPTSDEGGDEFDNWKCLSLGAQKTHTFEKRSLEPIFISNNEPNPFLFQNRPKPISLKVSMTSPVRGRPDRPRK